MNTLRRIRDSFRAQPLTGRRVAFALGVALVTDAIQILLGPLGWAFIDQALDVIAMILTARAIGFHFLLLPTFVVEFLPLLDMLPTWTGCVLAVLVLRKREQRASGLPPLPKISPAPPDQNSIIDI